MDRLQGLVAGGGGTGASLALVEGARSIPGRVVALDQMRKAQLVLE